MYLDRAIPIGSILVVQIKSQTSDTRHEFAGQVMHAQPREPNGWYVGLEFLNPIDAPLLDELL